MRACVHRGALDVSDEGEAKAKARREAHAELSDGWLPVTTQPRRQRTVAGIMLAQHL